MYEIPKTFDIHQLVGQRLYSFVVSKNLLQLDLGRVSSLTNGKYRDYARIDVEFGLEVRSGKRIDRYLQQATDLRQLRYAAGTLADLLDTAVIAVAIEQVANLRFTFEKDTQLVLLASELESFHIHTPKESITV